MSGRKRKRIEHRAAYFDTDSVFRPYVAACSRRRRGKAPSKKSMRRRALRRIVAGGIARLFGFPEWVLRDYARSWSMP